MPTELTGSPQALGLALPATDGERASVYPNAEKAAATRRAYSSLRKNRRIEALSGLTG